MQVFQVKKGDVVLIDNKKITVNSVKRDENHKFWGDVVFINDLHPIFSYLPIKKIKTR